MFARILKAYRLLDGFRRLVVNVLFLLVIVAFVIAGWYGTQHKNVPEGTLLTIDIVGEVKDTIPEDPPSVMTMMMAQPLSMDTRLSDIVQTLDVAATDPRVAGVILNVDEMAGVGMASAREIGAAIDRYRERSSKQVWVWGDSFSQSQYLIVSHADHVGLHPMGNVGLKGLSATSLYWGRLFKSIGIEVEVHKAGAFKSAPEIFTSGAPSSESLMAQKSYLDDAWQTLVKGIEKRRGMEEGTVDCLIQQIVNSRVEDASLATMFFDAGLVDALETKDDFLSAVEKKYSRGGVVTHVDMPTYLMSKSVSTSTQGAVAVVVAEGEISSMPDLGGVTPQTFNVLIDEVQANPEIQALVLRINSPGGDALASELIRARLEKFHKETNKPIIVSMGNVAASGGYWIATAGNQIVSDPLSITGSIGVFSMSVRAERLMSEFEIGRGGYRTTPLADVGMFTAEPSLVERRLIEGGVMRTYAEFKRLVAQSRHMDLAQVESLAQGRVWTGKQAVKYGLADRLGGIYDAIDIAKKTAGLDPMATVLYYEPQNTSWKSYIRTMIQTQVSEQAERLLEIDTKLRSFYQQMGRSMAWAPFEPTF